MKLFWLDLETTGLVANVDEILEIAVWQSEIETPFDAHQVFHAVLPKASVWMDDFVTNMHTKNGLLEECKKSSTTWLDVEVAMRALVPEVSDPSEKAVLAGSSVHFDHKFLLARAWGSNSDSFAKRFSHRYYDVSAVKLFCRSIGMPKLPRAEAHRAIDDIKESIEHARLCAEWIQKHGGPHA